MAEQKNETLKLDDSVKQNSKGQVILGRLEGPCADFFCPTRNGRQYDETLWEKVFNDEVINEYFEAGGIPGELDHPTDRLDTCSEKIAIMMPEKPTKDSNGHLIAKFDILDTPNGRIAYTLAKYGYKLGISSRGNGETYIADDGSEHVDEDSYDFRAFDLVLLPAVKAARLKMVESLQNGKTFNQAINEQLERAKPDEKKVMQETLQNLNLLKNEEYNHESVIDNKSDVAANDAGAEMIKQLQESLLAQQKLERQVTELQEKLSVCYAKEAKYGEDLNKYKSTVQNLSQQARSAKALQSKVESLETELKTKDTTLTESLKKSNENTLREIKLRDSKIKSLTETLSVKDTEIKNANSKLSKLSEEFKVKEENYSSKINELNEQLSEQKKNLTIKTTEYSNKLSSSNKLVEQYRKTAKLAVNKYVESQAVRLGIKSEEIFNKLPSNYSFNDIDRICEDLGSFKVKVSNLPFNVEQVKTAKIVESKTIASKTVLNDNDNIDESLVRLAKLND